MAKYRHVIPIIEQAVAKPKCRFPVKWEDGYRAFFPHCARMRKLSRLLSAAAIVDAYDGQKEDALDKVVLNYRIVDSLKDEPNMISQLVRIAVASIADRSLLVVSDSVDVDERSAKRIHQLLSDLDFSDCTTKAHHGERAMLIMMVRNYQTTGKIPDLSDDTEKDIAGATPFFYADVAYLLDRWKLMIPENRKPYRVLVANDSKVLKDDDPPTFYLLSRMFMPITNKVAAKRDGAIARLALSDALLALKLYKHKHGQYPATLAQAASDTGLAIPDDPFSGKSLIYRKQGQGCIVYSIDDDLKDNGGAQRPTRSASRGSAMPPMPPSPPGASGPPPQAMPDEMAERIRAAYPGPPAPPGSMPGMPTPPPDNKDYDIVVKLDH